MLRTFIVVFVMAILVAGCNQEPVLVSASQITTPDMSNRHRVVWDNSPVLKATLPLDSEQNPFRGKYREWDRWVFEHQVSSKPSEFIAEPNRVILTSTLTKEGYLVPQVEFEIMVEQAATEGHSLQFFKELNGRVFAEGLMTPALIQIREDAIWSAKAKFYPTIPTWLSSNPPLKTMLLPDGRVATLGELGSGLAANAPEHSDSEQHATVNLYSKSGELLASKNGGEAYIYDLLSPKFPGLFMKAMDDGWNKKFDDLDLSRQGYLAFKTADGKLLYTYDFFGNLVTGSPSPQDEHFFNWINADFLKKLAAWQ